MCTTLFAATLLALAAPPAVAQDLSQDETPLEDCTTFGPQGLIVEYECIGRNIKRKERRMENAFGDALEAVRKHEEAESMQDYRRSHVYLEWSQAAWKEFAEQNCTVVAGLSGGSNAWVSRYWTDCYFEELDRRIRFLEEVAAGKIGAN